MAKDGNYDIKALDASGPRDPDQALMATKPIDGPAEDAQDFPVQLPEGMTESFLLAWAQRRKKSFQEWAKGEFDKIEGWHKSYEGKPIAGQTSNATVPMSNSIVETDTAKRITSMFNKAKVVDAIALYAGPAEDNENKILIDDLVNQEILFGHSRTPEKSYDAIKAEGIDGTGIGKAFWEFYECEHTEPIMSLDPLSGMPTQTGEKKVITRKGRPNWERVPLINMIWDKRLASRIQDSEYVGQQTTLTMNELLIQQDAGDIANVDKIAQLAPAGNEDQADPELKRRANLTEQGASNKTTSGDGDEGVYKMDEWHGLIAYQAPQPDGTKKWTHANLRFRIVNDAVLIKCEPNPYGKVRHPYFSFRYSILPGRFLGAGVLAPVMGLQTYANNLQTSAMKLVDKAAKNPTFVSRGAGLNTKQLFLDENSIIPVLDHTKVAYHPIDVGAIGAVTRERSETINLARETVAANEQAQGVSNSGDTTATEAQIINANSGTRFQAVVDLNGYEFFGGLANIIYWLIREYAQDGELVVRESSQDGNCRSITRADLANDYHFVPITAAAVNNQRSQLANRMGLAQQIMQIQATQPQAMTDNKGNQYRFDVVDYFIKEIMPLASIKNGRTYLQQKSAEQIQQEQMAAMAGQAGLGDMAGVGGPSGGPGAAAGAGPGAGANVAAPPKPPMPPSVPSLIGQAPQ